MSYLDTQKQLDEITSTLKQELQNTGAMDETGKVINTEKFERTMDAAIDKCRNILNELEMQRYDPNSTNITYSTLNWLESVKRAKSFATNTDFSDGKEEKVIADLANKEQKEGRLAKIFVAIRKVIRRQNFPVQQSRGK
ncbi:MAG: hypothetical protein J5742_03325 [Alphaproteobacteria bacterium]|nr:hypothetical protein [Alphaproteobacteria bacterium]